MVYPEEPSIWAIPHIPALYDDDGDYGGKKPFHNYYACGSNPKSARRFIHESSRMNGRRCSGAKFIDLPSKHTITHSITKKKA